MSRKPTHYIHTYWTTALFVDINIVVTIRNALIDHFSSILLTILMEDNYLPGTMKKTLIKFKVQIKHK